MKKKNFPKKKISRKKGRQEQRYGKLRISAIMNININSKEFKKSHHKHESIKINDIMQYEHYNMFH